MALGSKTFTKEETKRPGLFVIREHENGKIELIGLGKGEGSVALSKSGWELFTSYLLPRIK